jgi:hypothetical protein
MFRFASALAAFALAALPVPALACSVASDYRVPTNLELAGQAQLILLAKVIGEEGGGEDAFGKAILVEPILALKGEMPAEPIAISGSQLSDERFLVLSNPYEFGEAHPLSYSGACIRRMFPLGTTALFFLEQRDGQWMPSGDAFSRWAEDVPGEEAPWVKLTQIYITASRLSGEERKGVLEAERDMLREWKDDPVALLMAADIDRQLKGANEAWNVLMQRQMQEMGSFGPDNEAEAEEPTNSVDAALDAMRATPEPE